jgi:cell wall-associated NlpC family hydrolase
LFRSNVLDHTTRRVATVLTLILSLGTLSTIVATSASADTVASKRAEAARIASQLDTLAERASILTEDYNEARVKAGDLEGRTRRAQADLASTAAKADAAVAALKRMSIDAYIHGGLTQAGVAAAVTPRAEYYARTAANREQDAIDGLKAAKLSLAERNAGLVSARDQARRALAAVNAKKHAAEAAEAAQRSLLAKVKGDLAQLVAADQARRSNTRASRGHSRNIGTPPSVDVPAPNPGAAGAIREAKNQLGKPYHYGSAGPDSYDCSGLTSYVWRVGGGRSLPHSSRAQYAATSRVALNDIAPGDLVFFGSSVGSIHHVGIYVGGGQMINAPETGTVVRYQNAFRGDLVGVGRVN